MKVLSTTDKSDEYSQILQEYFRLVPLEKIAAMRSMFFSDKLSLEQKLKNFEQAKPVIARLKDLFKQRTIDLNEYLKKKGYSNWIEGYLSKNKITKDKYQTFLDNIDNFISLVINEDVPAKIIMKQEKDWNMFNTPYPLGLYIPSANFQVPEEVLDLVTMYDSRVSKYRRKIDIKFDDKKFSMSANYNKQKDIVEILVTRQRDDIYQTLGFVYMLGHALNMLELADQGGDPNTMSNYLSEYRSHEFAFKFIKSHVSKSDQKVLRYNLLSKIAEALFQIDIFTNDRQDYANAYAKAIRRCYPMTRQTENPFYVFYEWFLLRPTGELRSTMVDMELYLKDAKEL